MQRTIMPSAVYLLTFQRMHISSVAASIHLIPACCACAAQARLPILGALHASLPHSLIPTPSMHINQLITAHVDHLALMPFVYLSSANVLLWPRSAIPMPQHQPRGLHREIPS
jgi:hypothetical protein